MELNFKRSLLLNLTTCCLRHFSLIPSVWLVDTLAHKESKSGQAEMLPAEGLHHLAEGNCQKRFVGPVTDGKKSHDKFDLSFA